MAIDEASYRRDYEIAINELRSTRADHRRIAKRNESLVTERAVLQHRIAELETALAAALARAEVAEEDTVTQLDDLIDLRALVTGLRSELEAARRRIPSDTRDTTAARTATDDVGVGDGANRRI